MKNALKYASIIVFSCVFLFGPIMANNANAKQVSSKSAVRMLSRSRTVKPLAGGSAFMDSMAGTAAGIVAGEMLYDALKNESERQNRIPVNENPLMQKPDNTDRGCGCQGN